jgi:hypothetical protein
MKGLRMELAGSRFPPDDIRAIVDRMGREVSDDGLVDRAAALNWKTVERRLDGAVLKSVS